MGISLMLWALTILCAALAAVHVRNRGRSGPVAALAFVLSGPALGVLLLVGWVVFKYRRERLNHNLYGMEPVDFLLAMLIVAVGSALLASLVYGYRIRDQLRALREQEAPHGFLPFVRSGGASSSLQSLGLSPFATLDDLERAYREHAKHAHPDHGGDAERFKRLQKIYEQAKRQLAAERRSASQIARRTTVGAGRRMDS